MTTYVITAEMEILFGEYLEQDEKSKNIWLSITR